MRVKTQEQLEEELLQLKLKAHQEWLKHPLTADFIEMLKSRGDEYYKKLIDSAMVETDAEYLAKCRACISTCKTILEIVTNSNLFVDLNNKPKQQ